MPYVAENRGSITGVVCGVVEAPRFAELSPIFFDDRIPPDGILLRDSREAPTLCVVGGM